MKHPAVKFLMTHKWWVKPFFMACVFFRIGHMDTLKFIGRYGLNVRAE